VVPLQKNMFLLTSHNFLIILKLVIDSVIIVTILIEKRIKRMTNLKIRDYAKRRGVCLWQIAKALNVSEATITRLFRDEIIKAIDSIFNEKERK